MTYQSLLAGEDVEDSQNNRAAQSNRSRTAIPVMAVAALAAFAGAILHCRPVNGTIDGIGSDESVVLASDTTASSAVPLRPTSQQTLRSTFQPQRQSTQHPTTYPTFKPTRPSGPTSKPTPQFIPQATSHPTLQPTPQPTPQPTYQHTSKPTSYPTLSPTQRPTPQPSSQPTLEPTPQPTSQPTRKATQVTSHPTLQPTPAPTLQPTSQPTSKPTSYPTFPPTQRPTPQPSSQPTLEPTPQPTSQPTRKATPQPTYQPGAFRIFYDSTQCAHLHNDCCTVDPDDQPSCELGYEPALLKDRTRSVESCWNKVRQLRKVVVGVTNSPVHKTNTQCCYTCAARDSTLNSLIQAKLTNSTLNTLIQSESTLQAAKLTAGATLAGAVVTSLKDVYLKSLEVSSVREARNVDVVAAAEDEAAELVLEVEGAVAVAGPEVMALAPEVAAAAVVAMNQQASHEPATSQQRAATVSKRVFR